VTGDKNLSDWIKPVADKPGVFHTEGVGKERDVDLVPFYREHRRTYAVYWDMFTQPEWEQKQAEYAAEQARAKRRTPHRDAAPNAVPHRLQNAASTSLTVAHDTQIGATTSGNGSPA
jgi:hypothetical protein